MIEFYKTEIRKIICEVPELQFEVNSEEETPYDIIFAESIFTSRINKIWVTLDDKFLLRLIFLNGNMRFHLVDIHV